MNTLDRTTKRILVVEDEPSIGIICQRVLTGEGFEVDCAANGRVAQDRVEKKQFDLCLIDMRTPKMNGIEFYQWLQKKDPQLAGRVIFTTGEMLGGDNQAFVEQSGKPFLPKPFTPNELRAVVQETLKEVEK